MNATATLAPSPLDGGRRFQFAGSNLKEVPDEMPPAAAKLGRANLPLRKHSATIDAIYDGRGQQVAVISSRSVKGRQTAAGTVGHELGRQVLSVPQLWEDVDYCVLTNALRLLKLYAVSCVNDKNWKKFPPDMLSPKQVLMQAGMVPQKADATLKRLQSCEVLQLRGDIWVISQLVSGFERGFAPLQAKYHPFDQPLPGMRKRYKPRTSKPQAVAVRAPAPPATPVPVNPMKPESQNLVNSLVGAMETLVDSLKRL